MSKNIIIYSNKSSYSAFPDIERLHNEDLVVGFREAVRRSRITHLDSTSKAVLVRSKDGGKTWDLKSKVIVYDDEYGVQDPSIVQLKDGTLIANFFKWEVIKEEPFGRKERGTFVVRSFDNGYTWEKEAIKVNVPNYSAVFTSDAILELPSGELLIPLYARHPEKPQETDRALVMRSRDKGKTWDEPTTIAYDPLGNVHFREPQLVYLSSGKIICMMRVGKVEGYLYQSESLDNGYTWSIPKKTDMWGHPAHLLYLKDGRVFCSYGYRRPPYGIRACLSNDEGKTWDLQNEIIIRNDGLHGDLGYPSSVEIEDKVILATYYFHSLEGVRFIEGSFLYL